MRRLVIRCTGLLAAFAVGIAVNAALGSPATADPTPATERATRASDGTPPDVADVIEQADEVDVSSDGRWVVFVTAADNVVTGDTNGLADVYAYDTQSGVAERISIATDGTQGNAVSRSPSVSSDGQTVAFESAATNLVVGDGNAKTDVLVRDRVAGTTELVSLGVGGAQANADATDPDVSDSGAVVAFESTASNLVSGDSLGWSDVFVRNRGAGTTTRVSVGSGGQGNNHSSAASISGDGTAVAFTSNATNLVSGDTNAKSDVFVRNVASATTERISVGSGGQGNGIAYEPAIAGDGQTVAFRSSSTNLVAGDTNGVYDVFVRDRTAGLTERVSVASDGSEADGNSYAPSLSTDGQIVAFASDATDLAGSDTNVGRDVFTRDRGAGTTVRASLGAGGTEGSAADYPALAGDGASVVFVADDLAGDDGLRTPVRRGFRRNLQAGTTEVVTASADGTYLRRTATCCSISGQVVSADGRYVAFASDAADIVSGDTNGSSDVFVYDRRSGLTERVSVASDETQANFSSWDPAISDDGSTVVYRSIATNLISGDTNLQIDVFVRDRAADTTQLASVSSGGVQANGATYEPTVSGDGSTVAFRSASTNLVPGDTNSRSDVFVRDLTAGSTTIASVAGDGTLANNHSYEPSLSADGSEVAFHSFGSNLVTGDTNNQSDVFVHDRSGPSTERVSVASGGGEANGPSYSPSISGGGDVVAYRSSATNLVGGDGNGVGDVFVRDTSTDETAIVSVAGDGTQGTLESTQPAVSGDGAKVAFASASANLVPGDTNSAGDVFVRDLAGAATTRVSVASDGTQGNGASIEPGLDGDGDTAVFESAASNLVAGETPAVPNVYTHGPTILQMDWVSIGVSGSRPYANAGDVTGGGFTVRRDSKGIVSVTGSGRIPGVSGGEATVVVSASRIWILPLYSGTVAVSDPGAGFALSHPLFFTQVRSAGATSATCSSSWIDTSRWPWSGYRVTWTVQDVI